jgi:hypothetical protein
MGQETLPPTLAAPSITQGKNRMPELGTYGSVRGARSNARPYRDRCICPFGVLADDPAKRPLKAVGYEREAPGHHEETNGGAG